MAGIDYSSLPMGANPETDQIVGYTEFGEPIRRARFGGAEYSIEQVATGKQGSAVKEAIKHPLDTVGAVASGVAGSIWNGLQTPGRAARGETITNGDLTDTLGLAAVGPVGGTAPQGALRSGLSRTETSQQILDMLKGGKAADVKAQGLTGASGAANNSAMTHPIFDKASRVASELRKTYGDSVEVSSHPSPYGNSAYLRVKVPAKGGGAYTETGFRLSDHSVGERRKGTDNFSTIIDDDSVTPESLLEKVRSELARGVVDAEALSAKMSAREAMESAESTAQMNLWKSLDERAKSDFAASQGPLAMSKQARPAVRARQYWEANAGSDAVESAKAQIRAWLEGSK